MSIAPLCTVHEGLGEVLPLPFAGGLACLPLERRLEVFGGGAACFGAGKVALGLGKPLPEGPAQDGESSCGFKKKALIALARQEEESRLLPPGGGELRRGAAKEAPECGKAFGAMPEESKPAERLLTGRFARLEQKTRTAEISGIHLPIIPGFS